jgi:MFS family permease
MQGDVRAMVAGLVPIYGITVLDVFGTMLMVPLLPYVAQRYGASGAEVGALLATTAVASVVAAPLWGAASDRLGRKPIVLISQAISFVGYLLVAWAPSLALLYAARGVAGIGGGNLGVTQSYIADVTDDAHRDRAYALFGVAFGIGIVLGPLAGGFLVHYGLWAPFAAAAALELVTISLTLRFLPATRPNAPRRSTLVETARLVARNLPLRSLIVRHFAFIFAIAYFFGAFALFTNAALHLGPAHTSWLLAIAGTAGGLAFPLLVFPLAKRVGDALVAQLGLALSALAYAALSLPQTLLTFGAMLVVWAIGSACVEPTLSALISERAPTKDRGAVMGFNDAMSNLALVLAPTLGGWMVDRHRPLFGLVPAAVVLAAFAIGMRARGALRGGGRNPSGRTQSAC